MSFFWRTLDVVGSFHYGHIQFLNKATSNHKNFTINRIKSNRSKIYSVWFVYYCSREREREREEIKPRNRCWHGRGRLWCCLWGRHRLFSKSVASPFLTLTQISLSLSISPKKKKKLLLREGLRGFRTLFLSLSLGSVERKREKERNRSKWQPAMKEWKKEREKREKSFFSFSFFYFYFLWLVMREKVFPTTLAFSFFF